MKYLAICGIYLISCTPNITERNPTGIVETILDDIVNDGVSLFDYQRANFSKTDWCVLLSDKLLPLDSMMHHSTASLGSLFQGSMPCGYRDKVDVKGITVNNLRIVPTEWSSTLMNKDQLKSSLINNQSDAFVLVSQVYCSPGAESEDVSMVLVNLVWPGNFRVIYYELGDENRKISKREIVQL